VPKAKEVLQKQKDESAGVRAETILSNEID
jgi:hypothetical protein